MGKFFTRSRILMKFGTRVHLKRWNDLGKFELDLAKNKNNIAKNSVALGLKTHNNEFSQGIKGFTLRQYLDIVTVSTLQAVYDNFLIDITSVHRMMFLYREIEVYGNQRSKRQWKTERYSLLMQYTTYMYEYRKTKLL